MNDEHSSPERSFPLLSSSLPPQALRRPKIHRHSFELWTTDYRSSHTPHPHHPPTTRPTTMTSSTNTLQIITRTRTIKPSPFSRQPSPTPQTPNIAVGHPSLSTTRASPPFPINPSGTTLPLHPHRPLARNRRGHFGRRSYSILLKVHTITLIKHRIQILPDSLYCRLYVLTVVIQTIVDLAIEGELLVRFHQAGLGAGDDTVAGSRKMKVYLGIFVLAQYVNSQLINHTDCDQGIFQRISDGHGFGCCI